MFIVSSECDHNKDGVVSGCGEKDICLPWLSVEVLFMSPEMKEDSDCFLTVSFHILLMRLCVERKEPLIRTVPPIFRASVSKD